MSFCGYVLIALSFLASSLIAVQSRGNEVDWGWFGPSLALGVIGVVLARLGSRIRTRHAEMLVGQLDDLRASLDRIVSGLRQLRPLATDEHAALRIYREIDDHFAPQLSRFVDARESLIPIYGLQTYADIMNDFAAGERYLNRVWSASVDGYVDEVAQYLPLALHQFEEAWRKLAALPRPEEGDVSPLSESDPG